MNGGRGSRRHRGAEGGVTAPSPVLRSIMGDQPILSVTQLSDMIAAELNAIGTVGVIGEVSNLKYHSSGHIYFSLKDERSQLRAIIFHRLARGLKFRLEDGQELIAVGRVSLYHRRGDYSLIVEHIEPAGIGRLELAFRQLKEKLEREGLFAPDAKKPLPRFPKVIGIVTSLTGAAIHDMLRAVRRRNPAQHVLIAPAAVQGDGAAAEIAEALGRLDGIDDVEVIIVARGGGSLEDLWAFNEELLARAVFACKTPVISGVGHEVDVTIADLVADARAATPTAAAELATPDVAEVRERLAAFSRVAAAAVGGALERSRNRLQLAISGLKAIRRRLHDARLAAAVAGRRVADALKTRLGAGRRRWQLLRERIASNHPIVRLADDRRRLEKCVMAATSAVKRLLSSRRHAVLLCRKRLEALSPLAVLSRGYAVIKALPQRFVITSAAQLHPGRQVEIMLHDGSVSAVVEDVTPPVENDRENKGEP